MAWFVIFAGGAVVGALAVIGYVMWHFRNIL